MDKLNANAHGERHFSPELLGHKPKNNSFFGAPLFVGFNPKGSESDSVRSPTSPLDLRVFSNLGNPQRSEKSSHEKIWYKNKVGLSIIDSLDFQAEHSGKVRCESDSKNILFGPQLRTKPLNLKGLTDAIEAPKSLPKYVGIFPNAGAKPSNVEKDSSSVQFEIGGIPFEPSSCRSFGSFSFDSRQSGSHLSRLSKTSSLSGRRSSVSESATGTTIIEGSKFWVSLDAKESSIVASSSPGTGLSVDIPLSDIELSEDYTCVRIHGPNPKVTHIFGDFIFECNSNDLANGGKNKENGKAMCPPTSKALIYPNGKVMSPAASRALTYPSSDFLRFCYSCKKELDGEDIYMYRGEKAFCSCYCRLQEILVDKEMDKSSIESCEDSSELRNGKEFNLFICT